MTTKAMIVRFALEACWRLCIFSNLVRVELQGDKAVEPYITHPSAAEFLDNPVVRVGLSDHLPNMLMVDE